MLCIIDDAAIRMNAFSHYKFSYCHDNRNKKPSLIWSIVRDCGCGSGCDGNRIFARIHFDDIIAKHLFFCVDAIYDLEPSSWCARARPLILICWCRMLNWSSVNWTWKHISWMQWFWLVALAAAIGEAFDVSMPFIIASFSNKNPFSNGAKIPRAHSIAIIFDFWSSEFTQFPKSPHNTVWVDIFCSAKSDVWLLFWYDLHYFPWTFFGLHSNSILFEIMRVISLPRAQF